jgi:hypothetical protein
MNFCMTCLRYAGSALAAARRDLVDPLEGRRRQRQRDFDDGTRVVSADDVQAAAQP